MNCEVFETNIKHSFNIFDERYLCYLKAIKQAFREIPKDKKTVNENRLNLVFVYSK